ncbi:hypothetical protein CO613_04080 [Lysobacteraceae bacterium NML07-0707]|nr:hypothetical protein CO613_04080 [Xanthomonadaceae bacterium NML07-0707]
MACAERHRYTCGVRLNSSLQVIAGFLMDGLCGRAGLHAAARILGARHWQLRGCTVAGGGACTGARLERLFAIIDPANIASRKILVRHGFVHQAFQDFDGLPGEVLQRALG